MIPRPKTGFKQKSDDELMKAHISMVDKYTDLLYEDKYEEKVRGARLLLYLMVDPQNMYHLLSEKADLLDIIARTLKDEHKKNMELSIHLLAFFYSISYYEEFHDFIISHSIGETCLNVIEFQYAKFIIRRNEIILKENELMTTNPMGYQKELDKFLFLIRKQDRILRTAFTILMHLAEDQNVEKKMVKRDIIPLLVKNLDRTNINLIVVLLLFIKKLSIYDVNKDALIKNNVLGEFIKYLNHFILLKLSIKK